MGIHQFMSIHYEDSYRRITIPISVINCGQGSIHLLKSNIHSVLEKFLTGRFPKSWGNPQIILKVDNF